MPNAADLRGIGENAVGLIAPHRALLLPARLPQLVDDRHVFVGGVGGSPVEGGPSFIMRKGSGL